MNAKSFDAIVVGGGPAGLSAALILGRMRREVLLLDADAPANAVSNAMHGFLAQDGVPPTEVRRIAAAQLDPYESVERRATAVVSARRVAEGFEVTLADGAAVTGRRLLVAHGMHYGLPQIEGVADLWGERVFHCPYCHGWEVRDRALAVYASGERAVHQALLLRSLSEEIVLLSAGTEVASEDRSRLALAGVEMIDDPVERLAPTEGGMRIEFAGKRRDLERHALFIQPDLSLASQIAPSLGAVLTEIGSVHTDETGLTAVPGLYVAGDAGAELQSVAIATASGARAAYAINAGLANEGLGETAD
jgi:thioredoxin reductase